MSANGNSGAPIDYDAEFEGALTQLQANVTGLAASKATKDALKQRGIAPEPLAEGLRYRKKYDTVTLAIDDVRVTAVMARDGTRHADLVAEGDAWASVIQAYDTVSHDAAADQHRDLWSRPLAAGVAVIAWRTKTGRRIVVHGPESGRLAYAAALRALKRGVFPVAAILAAWHLLRRIAAHPSAATSTIALVAAGTALSIAAMKPTARPDRDAPVPGVSVIVPAPASRSPGIGHQTSAPTVAPGYTHPGYIGPSGERPAPAGPRGPGALPGIPPLLPAPTPPTATSALPVVPLPTKPPSVPVPQPTTPPRRRRPKCTLGLFLDPLLGVCVLPGQ